MTRILILILLVISATASAQTVPPEPIPMQTAATATGNGTSVGLAYYGGGTFEITITGTATVTFKAYLTDIALAKAVSSTNLATPTVQATTATVSGLYTVFAPGLRVIAAITSYTSGTVTVTMRPVTAYLSKGGGGSGGTVTDVTGTSPIASTGGATPAISCPTCLTTADKDSTGGYVGLTLFKIDFKNAANTFTSFFTNSNSAARNYTFQNRDGTIADDTDLALKQDALTFPLSGALGGTGVANTGLTLNFGAGGTLGSNAFTSTAYAPIASPTFTGTPSGPSFATTGTGGLGFAEFLTQSSAPSAPASGYREYADSTGRRSWIRASDGFTRTWDATLTGNRVYTLPDASSTFPVFGQVVTFAGPTAARTVTLPDSSFTVPTNTLNNLGTTSINADLLPASTQNLGSATLPWLSTFTGSTTQYESVVSSAGLITHTVLGSATNIGFTFTPKGTGALTVLGNVVAQASQANGFLFASPAPANSGLSAPAGAYMSLYWNNGQAASTNGSGLTINGSQPLGFSASTGTSMAWGISPISALLLGIGNGSVGDFSGHLKLTNLTAVGNTILGVGTSIKNIRHGITSALVAGTLTVTDTGATANTRYFFTAHTLGTVSIPSTYYVSSRSNGASFTVTASVLTDTSTLDWMAIEP